MIVEYFVIVLGNTRKDEMVIYNIDSYFHNRIVVAPDKFREFWKGFSEDQKGKIKKHIMDILLGKVSQKSKDMTAQAYKCDVWDKLIEEITLYRKKTKQTDEFKESRIYLNMVSLSKWYEIELYLEQVEEKVKEKIGSIEL